MVTTREGKCIKCGDYTEVLSQNNYCFKCFEKLQEEIKKKLYSDKK